MCLPELPEALKTANDDIHRMAFDIVVEPFTELLASVPTLPSWAIAASPSSFSLSPSAYISQARTDFSSKRD